MGEIGIPLGGPNPEAFSSGSIVCGCSQVSFGVFDRDEICPKEAFPDMWALKMRFIGGIKWLNQS